MRYVAEMISGTEDGGTIVPFKKPYKAASTRPDKIFLLDKIVQEHSVLDAAIAGELYYWIAKGEKPWRIVSDYAQWFNVNEKTIRLNIQNLGLDKFFKITRTRMRSGSFGANQFSTTQSCNGKALNGLYISLLNNNFDSKDFGEFDPDEPNYKEIPRFQLLYLDTIKEVGDLKAAYLLDRICWASNARRSDSLYFRSKAHFARWSNMDRKTAIRKLNFLEENGQLECDEIHAQLVVRVYEVSPAFSRFCDFMENTSESRIEALNEQWS